MSSNYKATKCRNSNSNQAWLLNLIFKSKPFLSLFLYMVRGKVLISLIYMRLSWCPNTICWRDCLFFHGIFLLCWRLIGPAADGFTSGLFLLFFIYTLVFSCQLSWLALVYFYVRNLLKTLSWCFRCISFK